MPEHVLMSEIEIITDGGRRRRWTAAEKLRIVEETLDEWRGGLSPSRSLRTGRDTLASSGSHCSATPIWLCPIHEDPPVAGCPRSRAEQRNPFAPAPLQDLHHYYELLRPCATHR